MIGRNLAVLTVLGAGVLCGAEKIELNSVNAWERQYGVTEKEGVLSIPGKCSFTMKESSSTLQRLTHYRHPHVRETGRRHLSCRRSANMTPKDA